MEVVRLRSPLTTPKRLFITVCFQEGFSQTGYLTGEPAVIPDIMRGTFQCMEFNRVAQLPETFHKNFS